MSDELSGPSSPEKVATGIRGFDAITGGGIPAGRLTLVAGGAGCGKTLFGTEFLLRGAAAGVPGVLFAFEERRVDIVNNAASLGFDLPDLVDRGLLRIDDIRLDPVELTEVGDWNLEGLLIRMQAVIDEIGAKRIAIDTLETLFATFENHAKLRREMVRLVRWIKERGLTSIVTAEAGDDQLTRHGIEEFVSDCVISLDHRVSEHVSTRRIRIVKYRGSSHGTNEYPFLIDEHGLSIQPITSVRLDYEALTDTISSGVAGIDALLDGRGYYRGSTVLISGTSGTGKTTVAMSAIEATADAGERVQVFAFEESPSQIRRNMGSVGMDLARVEARGLLEIRSGRPTLLGLEQHLMLILDDIERFAPKLVVIDPVSSFSAMPTVPVTMLVIRLIDALKSRGITALMTYLAHRQQDIESTVEGISSLADTWILLRTLERARHRHRTIHVLKSRGMHHSSAVGELVISDHGVDVRGTELDAPLEPDTR